MSKLVFKIGEETVPTVLNHDEFSTSPFAQQLDAGIQRLQEMLDKWKERQGSSKNDETTSVLKYSEQPVDNNIIAFLGERGSGKTSCLYSMKEIFLKNERTKDYRRDTEFLHVIDPSFFDEHHNILEIFLGELYHEYEKMTEPWERMTNAERQKIRTLHGWFAKVRQSVTFLSAQRLELPEDQEGLSALSEGVSLRLLVGELVKAYLTCRGKKYLVVSIDDIDLNIREAYRMMEQIRKYLVVPNVVILLAAKLEQLKNSIVLNLAEYYKTILNTVVDMHRILAMADRYLDKFIPLERRISMPGLTDYSTAELEIIAKGENTTTPDNSFESVEFAVLSLIYQKCGYLFYNYEETPSLIIPETLRELRSFVTMLFEMPDRSEPEQHRKNKEAFKRYFREQWMQRMPSDQHRLAKDILKERDYTKINKTVVTLLLAYTKSLGFDTLAKQEVHTGHTDLRQIRINEVENPTNYSENISIGDVMAVLSNLNNIAASSRIDYLIFFITTYYSMRLYELYDLMTDSLDRAALNQPVGKSKFPALKSSKDYKIPEYLQIAGNSFFTLTGESFLPAARNRAYSRESSQMNGVLLMETIEDLINEYENSMGVIKDPKFILRLNLVEFFMLCASRKIESKDKFYSPFEKSNWRAETSEFYFYSFDSNTKNILFDITAPFVNFGFIPLAYHRFRRKILDVAETCSASLYSRVYRNKRSNTQNTVHDLLSRVSIRNAEVLKDLNLWMIKNKEKLNDSKDSDLTILKKYFENVSSYSVRTYELNTGADDYHTISFTPFEVIVEFLKRLSTESDDKNFEKIRKEQEILFMRIYRQENVVAADTVYSLKELIRILQDSNESNIPAKDALISRIMKKTGRINSNLLVEYLAQIDVVEKVLFSSYLDNSLFDKYKSFIADNMRQHAKKLNDGLKSTEQRLDILKSEYQQIEQEHSKIQKKIDAGVKRIHNQENNLVTLENNHQQLLVEISVITEKIRQITARMDEISNIQHDIQKKLKEETDKFRKTEQEYTELQTELIHADKEPSLRSKIDFLEKELNEIDTVRNEMTNKLNLLTKETINLTNQNKECKEVEINKRSESSGLQHSILALSSKITKDKNMQDELLKKASALKRHKMELKTVLDNTTLNRDVQRKEYEGFVKRRSQIITALDNADR